MRTTEKGLANQMGLDLVRWKDRFMRPSDGSDPVVAFL